MEVHMSNLLVVVLNALDARVEKSGNSTGLVSL
jgi:hypothetical protein